MHSELKYPHLLSGRRVATLLAIALIAPVLLVVASCGGGGVESPTLPNRIVLLTAFPAGIDPDGSETSLLTVTVLTGGGSARGSSQVEFSTNLGVLGFEQLREVQRTTASDGITTLELRGDGSSGVATVVATSGEATAFAEVLIF